MKKIVKKICIWNATNVPNLKKIQIGEGRMTVDLTWNNTNTTSYHVVYILAWNTSSRLDFSSSNC